MNNFADIERGILSAKDDPHEIADPGEHLLRIGEAILENWLIAHGITPTQDKREGFRLLALHRQGAKHQPSFHACRETCRELIYQINLIQMKNDPQQITLAALVAMHLLLFIRGKMEIQELGEFCCNSTTATTSVGDR